MSHWFQFWPIRCQQCPPVFGRRRSVFSPQEWKHLTSPSLIQIWAKSDQRGQFRKTKVQDRIFSVRGRFAVLRMLLFRPCRGGSILRRTIEERVALFQSGHWDVLVEMSAPRSRPPTKVPPRASSRRDCKFWAGRGILVKSGLVQIQIWGRLGGERLQVLQAWTRTTFARCWRTVQTLWPSPSWRHSCARPVPNEILGVMGQDRITALEKADGGIKALLWARFSAELLPAQSHSSTLQKRKWPQPLTSTHWKRRQGAKPFPHPAGVDWIGWERHRCFSGWHRRFRPHLKEFNDERSTAHGGRWEDFVFRPCFLRQTVILLVGGRRWRCPHHPAGRGRGAGRSIDAHFVLLGTACSFGISEERVAWGLRPHLTPRGKDEGAEQEWRGAQRLSRSSRSSSVGHSRSCRVERRQEFADLPAGVQGPRHSVWPPGFHQ